MIPELTQCAASERADSKPWLEATRKLIETCEPGLLNDADENLCRHMVIETNGALAKAMNIDFNYEAEKELARVFALGLDVFRLLHRQQAMFYVAMAPAYVQDEEIKLFNPEVMEDVRNLSDADALAGHLINVSVFPLVHKMGDERGDNVSPDL